MANRKTVKLDQDTYNRLTEAKPFETMSYAEFIGELLNVYEGE